MLELVPRFGSRVLWKRPNSQSNSLNRTLHMRGNLGNIFGLLWGNILMFRMRGRIWRPGRDFETLWKELQQTLTKASSHRTGLFQSTPSHLPSSGLSTFGYWLNFACRRTFFLSYRTSGFLDQNLTNRPLDFYKDIDLNQKHR